MLCQLGLLGFSGFCKLSKNYSLDKRIESSSVWWIPHCHNLKYLEVFMVAVISCSMWQENVVSYNVWLNRWFSTFAEQMSQKRASPRGLNTQIIALNCKTTRLIECDPVLNSIPKCFVASSSKMFKIFPVKNNC